MSDTPQTKEMVLLQNLQKTLHQAKQELKNDLTRLATKKMPLMIEQPSTSKPHEFPASSIEFVQVPSSNLVELEPLDLDIE